MTENTKIQMFKTKVYAMINKLNCLNCGKPDNTTKVSTNKLLCSKWCCLEQSSQVITPHKNCVDSTYKCCNWCSKSQ